MTTLKIEELLKLRDEEHTQYIKDIQQEVKELIEAGYTFRDLSVLMVKRVKWIGYEQALLAEFIHQKLGL